MTSAQSPWLERGTLVVAIACAIVAVGLWTGRLPLLFGTLRADQSAATGGSAIPRAALPSGRSADSAADRLRIVVGGIEQPSQDLSEIPLSGDVLAGLAVTTPPDQRYARTFDLRLYREGANQPIDDARVQALASMRFMDHGTFKATALPSGGGHYQLPLLFVMSGEWQIDLSVSTVQGSGHIWVNLDVWQ